MKRTLIVYKQLRESGAGTVNMVDVELKFKGYDFNNQQVRQSLRYLVKTITFAIGVGINVRLPAMLLIGLKCHATPRKYSLSKGESYEQ